MSMPVTRTINLLDLGQQEDNERSLMTRNVEMYTPEGVVIHETLQNSMDAIQKSDKDRGTVSIWLDMDNQSVKITDNGRGFPFDLKLLGLGGTDKSSTDWNLGGNIGVGLKVVILSSKLFGFIAVSGGKRWSCRIADANRYLERLTDAVTINYTDPVDDAGDSGTEVSYVFPDDKVTEFVDLLFAYGAKVDDVLATTTVDKFRLAIEYYFRTYTYAGNVSRLLGNPGIKVTDISVNIVCRSPAGLDKIRNPELKTILQANGTFASSFLNKHWDFAEAVSRARAGASRPAIISVDLQPAGLIGQYSQNYVYARGFTAKSDFRMFLSNPHIRDPPNVQSYENLFDQISGMYLVIGSIPVIKKYLIEDTTRHFIAASGIPSAHMLDKPSRGGELGYIGNIHLIVNVKAKLNYGKQTITNTRLVGHIGRYFNDAYRATLKNMAKAIVGTSPGTTREPEAHTHTEIVTRRDLNIPNLSIMKEPVNETELIALFYELVGRGYLNEYRTYALFPWDQYDGKMMLKGPRARDFTLPTIDPDIPVVEFKHKVSDIVADFEDDVKTATDITLLVAWINDYRGTHMNYEVIEVRGSELEDRALKHVTTCLHQRTSGHKIQLLLLQEVVADIREGRIVPAIRQAN